MHLHSWTGRLHVRNRAGFALYALLAAVLILGMTLGTGIGTGLAQDDGGTPITDSGDSSMEQPAEDSVDEPAEPPAEEQTEPPTEEEPAVDEPTDEEQPSEPVGDPTDSGESTPDNQIPTDLPTETPTPTATAALPSLLISNSVSARCELAPEQPSAIASGGSQQYDCRADLGLSATAVDPGQVAIDWQVTVDTGGSWTAQLRTDLDHPWSELQTPPVLAAQSTLDDVVTAADGSGFASTETETFQLLLTRPACDSTPAIVQVQVSASPSLDGGVMGQSTLPEALRVEPALAAIAQPTVTFDGPLNFGSVDADASGPAVSSLSGTLGLTLTGMNATCGSWQISIGGNGMVGADGQPLTGSALVVLPTTDSGLPCDVRDGCRVASVSGDAAATPSQDITLDLELRLGDAVLTGTFSTSLTVTITPADDPTSDGNGV